MDSVKELVERLRGQFTYRTDSVAAADALEALAAENVALKALLRETWPHVYSNRIPANYQRKDDPALDLLARIDARIGR